MMEAMRAWVAMFWVCSLLGLPAKEEKLVVRVPMRDGAKLAANVFKPQGAVKLPVLLVRTPYNRGIDLIANYRFFVENGYAVVVQDVRGRYDSDGSFRPLDQEEDDGFDTLNWIARQPWSNGKIGMMGGSYVGIVQWKAALTGNSHLKAIFPVVSGYDEYLDRFYSRGGAAKLGHRLLWIAQNMHPRGMPEPLFDRYIYHLPLRTSDVAAAGQRVDFWQTVLDHPTYDSFWKRMSTRQRLDQVRVPVFAVGGWYDNFVESDLEAFSELRERSGVNRLVVGPWPHNMSTKFVGVDFGKEPDAPIRRYQITWFDYWLKSPLPAQEFPIAPLRIFVMGANKWRDEREWPLRRTRYTPFYLGGTDARSLKGDGTLLADPRRNEPAHQFIYDPRKPVPTMGGAVCCNPRVFPWGPMDQRGVETRKDVLVYTSAPLTRDLEITGAVRAALFVSTTATDTDFTTKLVDVFPDGRAINLCDGILRLRYRNGIEQVAQAKSGEVYQITVDAGVTSNVFRAGHRIRVEISSSNFPRFDRNPNTGREVADETELRPAAQKVFHGRQYPSYVLLPVIP